MAQKFPTKLVNGRICRCCGKPLSSNDPPISHFGETGTPKILEFRKLIIPELRVLALTKRYVGYWNEIEEIRVSRYAQKVCAITIVGTVLKHVASVILRHR